MGRRWHLHRSSAIGFADFGEADVRRACLVAVLTALMVTSIGVPSKVSAQTAMPPPEIRQLFDSMTPEERVGQLFMVTFTGTNAGQQSQIYDLIVNHHIGGVAFLAGNDKFLWAPERPTAAPRLFPNLREIALGGSSNSAPVTRAISSCRLCGTVLSGV